MASAETSKRRRERFIRYAPLLIWIAVIFFLSSGQGSMTQTSLFIRPFLEFLFPETPESTITIYHGYIRKFAHFAEYSALGFLASRAFFYSSRVVIKKYWFFFALGFVIFVASFDEANQAFNPARTASAWDTLLDITGGATAIFFYWRSVRRSSHSV